MITIHKRELTKTTLYSVWSPNGIPTFIEHKKCKILTKKGKVWKYTVKIVDDTNEIVYETSSNHLTPLDEIKAEVLFYDKEDALKYYKESLAEVEKDYKEEIKSMSKKMMSIKKRLKTVQDKPNSI